MDFIRGIGDKNLVLGAVALLGLRIAWRGVPLHPRDIGQIDKISEKPHKDPEWSYRNEEFADALDLTQIPVRRTSSEKKYEGADESGEAKVESVDVLVVGGAAAGLSTAACCQKEGLSVVVIEKNESVGDIWRSRYHRLHLHDIVEECHLPYMQMPDSYPVYPNRQEFARYLDAYKSVLQIRVENLHLVEKATRRGDPEGECEGWDVEVLDLRWKPARTRKFQCSHLVLANGIYNDPLIPKVPGSSDYQGVLTHSSRYTNAEDLDLVGKKVLVVGWGNSGCEIIVDLIEQGAKPTVLIRSGQVITPRWAIQKLQSLVYTHIKPLLKIPFGWLPLLPLLIAVDPLMKLITRLHYGYVERYGIKIHWKGVIHRLISEGVPPVMDVGTISAIQSGKCKVVNHGLKSFTKTGVQFMDDSHQEFDGVILATGYERFTGHKHFLDEKSLSRVSQGSDALRVKRTVSPGAEVKRLKGLWALFGRLQMLRDAAPAMAESIAVRLGRKKRSRSWSLLHHVLTATLVYYLYVFYKSA